ncbi:MAG TPA: hypothetical protein VF272_01840 [Candidatus Saccharimonadia bacterium]
MKFIGIAGGSGVGKSTLCYGLVDAEPEVFEVLNLDDYQYRKDVPNLPVIHGQINWDHPDIIRWSDLMADLNKLRSGKSITIDVWSHRSNSNYFKHGQMISRTLQPRPIVLIEGYLALYNSKLNEQYARKYYIDLNEATRAGRRKDKVIYEDDIVIPMHNKYVEPTKKNADIIFNVGQMSIKEVQRKVKEDIIAAFLL